MLHTNRFHVPLNLIGRVNFRSGILTFVLTFPVTVEAHSERSEFGSGLLLPRSVAVSSATMTA